MGGPRLLARELCLVALTLATLASCRRLLDGWTWFEPTATVAVIAHLVAATTRRLRWPVALSALAMLPAMAITIGLAFQRSTTRFLLPTVDTLDAVRTDLDAAWSTFGDIRAPTQPLDGYVLSIAAAIWIVAHLSDWAAFRLRSPLEAMLPSAIMFGFGAVMARGPYREAALAMWLPAVLVFMLAAQIDRRDAAGTWLTGTANKGRFVLIRNGALVAAAVCVFGLVLGPGLPGARSAAIVNIADVGDGGDGTRFVRSPLVEVQSQLVDLPDIEVFIVETDHRDYWRLASLDEFDGSAWRLRDSFEDATSAIPSGLPTGTVTDPVTQRFTITGLENVYAPAAFEPRRVFDVEGGSVNVSASLSTLVSESVTARGLSYRIESAVPRRDPALLSAANPADPDVFAAQLELPDDYSTELADEARRIVGGETQPYAQALALQNYFRTGFTYDLEVDAGQGIDRMEDFVFDVRAGYCEQFASTFAAFARVVGLPSRVVVGYTPGDFDVAAGVYRVRGIHAHAWPEVWIDGAGWVRFEPTPGRGAPGDTAYTGVPEAQDSAAGVPVPTTTSTAVPDSAAGSATTVRPAEVVPDGASAEQGSAAPAGSSSPWARRLVVIALVVVAVPVLLLGFTRWWRQRRRRRAADPVARIELAWIEACEAATLADLAPEGSETPHEYCSRVDRRLGSAAEPMRRLAAHTTHARYAPRPPASDTVSEAAALCDFVVAAMHARLSWPNRVRTHLVPPRPPRGKSVRARFDRLNR